MVSWGGARISLSQGFVLSREYFPSSYCLLWLLFSREDFLRIPELAINPLSDRIVQAFFVEVNDDNSVS